MSLRILIAEPKDFSPRAAEMLRDVGEVVMTPTDAASLGRAFQEFDVVWMRLATRIDSALLGPQPRCRVLATPVTGLDHIDLDACRDRNVRVVSLKGEVEFLKNIRATAEMTIGLALALLRHVPAASASVQAGNWHRDLFRGSELYGKTAGIVGLGRLGSIVARYLRAFDMSVVAYDPRSDFDFALARRAATLEELLSQSDLVSLHVTYDASTRHLIGPPEFAAIKPNAVLVNTSRGGVVDEQALLAALKSGRLAGAALDVLDGEPAIDTRHALVEYARANDNLLITPHLGGNTRESFEQTENFLAGRVLEALRELKLTVTSPAIAGQTAGA